MKMKIVFYSYSGNTKEVSERLYNALLKQGIECDIQAIHAVDENPNVKPDELSENPDVSAFDVLVFASPVRAFSITPIMKLYLEQLPDLNGKKAISFVTHHFPLSWLGGTQTNKTVKGILTDKNADVLETYVIDWSNKKREDQIQSMIESIKEKIRDNL